MGIEILPNLWIGDYNLTNTNTFITDNKITHLCNCTVYPINPILGVSHPTLKVQTLNLPNPCDIINDKTHIQLILTKFFQHLPSLLSWIHNTLTSNTCPSSSILIYCYDDLLLSTIIVLAFICVYGQFSLKKAIKLLKLKYPEAFENTPDNCYYLLILPKISALSLCTQSSPAHAPAPAPRQSPLPVPHRSPAPRQSPVPVPHRSPVPAPKQLSAPHRSPIPIPIHIPKIAHNTLNDFDRFAL